MSSFGTGSLITGGSGAALSTYTGTNGAQAGTDGLVPGPSIAQAEHLLGAGGDWTLEVKAIADLNDSSQRIATTAFVQTLVANAQIPGGNANLSALGDVSFQGLSDDQFLQYNAGTNQWGNVTLTVSSLTDVDLSGGVNDGEVLAYDANAGTWVPAVGGGGGGGGASELDDLSDVAITNPAAGHFLVHDGVGEFVNQTISTAQLTDGAGLATQAYVGQEIAALGLGTASTNNTGDFLLSTAGLNELSDIAITNPAAGHFLVHDGVGEFVNQTISTAQLTDGAGLATQAYVGQEIAALNLGTASTNDTGDFLLSTSGLDELSDVAITNPAAGHFLVHDGVGEFVNQTISTAQLTDGAGLATQAFVGAEITALNLGTASTNDTGDFLLSTASISDLSDVDTTGIADGNVLSWDAANTEFVASAPAQTYTDDDAQDAVNDLFITNNPAHSDISFVYDDVANTMTASVDASVARLASPALTGAPTAPTAVQGTNTTQIATTEFVISEVGAEITALNLGTASTNDTGDFLASSLVTLTNVAGGEALIYDGANATFINQALSTGNLSDGANLVSDNANTTFTADVDFTGGAYTADNPAGNAQGREIATASFVRSVVQQAGAVTQLSDLADVDNALAPADGEALLYVNANGQFESTLLSTSNLSDVDTAGIANGNVLSWDAANSKFVASAPAQTYTDDDAQDAVNDLFVTNNPTHTGLSFTYDDVANTMAVAVTGRLAEIEAMAATANNFIVADGNNFALTTPADARTALGLGTAAQSDTGDFLLSTAGLDDLSDVAITNPAAGHFLVHDGVGEFVNQTISTAQLTDGAGLATQVYVGQQITALNLGTASTNDTGDFLLSTAELSDLSDVAVTNPAAGHFLVHDGVGEFVNQTISTAQLTDGAGLATQVYVGQQITALNLGTASTNDTGDFLASTLISLTNVADGEALIYDGANATFENVSLSTGNLSDGANLVSDNVNTTFTADVDFSGGAYTADNPAGNAQGREIATASFVRSVVQQVGAVSQLSDLADVDNTLAPADGEVLLYVNANSQFESSALSTADLSNSGDIAFLNQAGTFAQQMVFSAEAQLDGGIDVNASNFTVDSATGDVATVGNMTIGGNLTVSGTTTTVNTTNLDISDQIISLNNGVANANTTDIGLFMDRGTSDPALFFWDEGDDAFKVATHTGAVDSTEDDFSSVAGLEFASMQVKTPAAASDDNSVATTEWVQDVVGGLASSLDDLTDVSVGANVDGQVLRNDGSGFENATLAHSDLSDHADYAPLASPNLTGNPTTPDQNALTNNARIANTKYVDSAVTAFGNTLGTASTNATGDFLQTANNLSDLANAGTARGNLGLGTSAVKDAGTGADEVLLLAQATTLPALDGSALTALGSVTTHSDVNITNPSEGQTLRYDAVAGDFENAKLSTSDLSNGTNVALLTGATFTGDLRASTQGANDSSTLVATTAFVQQEIGNASLSDVSDVNITNPAGGDFLRHNGAVFVNTSPVVADISDAGSSATKDAGTGADEVLLLAQASTLPALDGTALTGVLKTASNLSDVANAATARTNLGLGTAATSDTGAFLQPSNDLSDVDDAATARTNLGLGTSAVKDAGTGADNVLLLANANTLPALDGTALTGLLKASQNLADVANAATARTNLGLTDTATTLLTALLQVANNLSEIANAGGAAQSAARGNLGLGTVATLDSGTANGDVPVLGAQGLPAVSGENLTALGSVSTLSDVDTSNVADGNILTYSAANSRFQATAPAAIQGASLSDVGTALADGDHSGATGITFAYDANTTDIGLTLSIQSSDLTDLSSSNPQAGQLFVYDANSSAYVNAAISSDTAGVGTQAGNVPVLSTVALGRTNGQGDLVVQGRVMEVIDYGTVSEVFDADTDWALDYHGAGFADPVVYAAEDYGVLVV